MIVDQQRNIAIVIPQDFSSVVIAPMSRTTVLLGKLVPHVIVNLIQIVFLFLVGYLVLPLTGLPRLEWGAHPEGLIAVLVCASITANTPGLTLAALARSNLIRATLQNSFSMSSSFALKAAPACSWASHSALSSASLALG